MIANSLREQVLGRRNISSVGNRRSETAVTLRPNQESRRTLIFLALGGTISSEQVAKLLNLTRQGVDKRRASGKLIGISMGRRGYAYPLWQFQDGHVLSGLETVLKAMKEHAPWTQIMFMLTGDLRLEGETPLARFRQGDIDSVVQAARSYGEQGAA
jgi:biotin operon repressor